MSDECVFKANSFVTVIVVKHSEGMSDVEAIRMAIDLLKEAS